LSWDFSVIRGPPFAVIRRPRRERHGIDRNGRWEAFVFAVQKHRGQVCVPALWAAGPARIVARHL